jgi:hypothetical protein
MREAAAALLRPTPRRAPSFKTTQPCARILGTRHGYFCSPPCVARDHVKSRDTGDAGKLRGQNGVLRRIRKWHSVYSSLVAVQDLSVSWVCDRHCTSGTLCRPRVWRSAAHLLATGRPTSRPILHDDAAIMDGARPLLLPFLRCTRTRQKPRGREMGGKLEGEGGGMHSDHPWMA